MYRTHSTQNQPYYVVPRRGKRKKTVYYYRVIDQDRRVVGEWSTGHTRKLDAIRYCEQLLAENRLIPTVRHRPGRSNPSSFKDYFADWFDWPMDQEEPNCPYIQRRLKRGQTYSKPNTQIQRRDLSKYLLPAFGNRPKHRITSTEIEEWLYNLPEEYGITARTANNKYDLLRTMMTEAARLGDIPSNPCTAVLKLGSDSKARDILRLGEVDALFSRFKVEEIWDDPMGYVGSLLAATTGMRTGEIQALQPEQVHPDHIEVKYALERGSGELKPPKNGRSRVVPITPKLHHHLMELADGRQGFIFSQDGGTTPVYKAYFLEQLKTAMANIGISEEERRERNIVFHSWRIFCNTLLLTNGVAEIKVREIIGHLDATMTRHYTNIPLTEYFQETRRTIPELQDRILEAA